MFSGGGQFSSSMVLAPTVCGDLGILMSCQVTTLVVRVSQLAPEGCCLLYCWQTVRLRECTLQSQGHLQQGVEPRQYPSLLAIDTVTLLRKHNSAVHASSWKQSPHTPRALIHKPDGKRKANPGKPDSATCKAESRARAPPS